MHQTRAARYKDVFAVGEFRTLFASHLLSIFGDQLARVALAVLVFDRTSSAALAALTYALTLIPELAGGPLLAGLADAYPRRALMVTCDLGRAGLLAVMAVPGLPLWLMCALLVVVQLVGAPYKAARAAVLPTVLVGDRYEVGLGLMYTALQVGMLSGFAVAAPLVAWLTPGSALLLDAVMFGVSGLLVRAGIGPYPPEPGATSAPLTAFRATAVLVWRDRRLRYLLAMGSLLGCYTVPVGLAVPYAAQIGTGTESVGLLMAAHPAGCALGTVLLTRLVAPERRLVLLGPLAVATSVVLLPMAAAPGLVIAVALCLLCGLLAGHDAVAAATFSRIAPPAHRGQAYGLASALLRATQGLGIALGGVVAQLTAPSTAIAVFAVVGVLGGIVVAVGWGRARAGVTLA